MAEDTQVLIDFQQVQDKSSSSNENSDNLSRDSLDIEHKSWRLDYGSFRTQEFVPVTNQLVFEWSDINAYGEESTPRKKRKFFNFSKEKKTKKHILKNISGVAHPGELLVIMGSSGAGKTTLLNCMTFRNLRSLEITGVISVNKQPVTQRQLAAQSAYVQQDDLFICWLTVKEHLIFQSLVRMDSNYTYAERMQRVEEVMRELSLKKCQHVQIGQPGITKGISGGERKRLALAAELLTNPSLLFCDEPTSGLDSFMSLNVIQMLKKMAQTGRTVICTLHQPSSELFQMFDKIGLMASGRTAFLGTQHEAAIFFTKLQAPCPVNYNPADYYIQLLSIIPGKEESCRQAVKTICDAFDSSSIGRKIKMEGSSQTSMVEDVWTHKTLQLSPYKVSWCSQFRAVFWRSWLATKKNPRLTKVRFFQVLLVTFLISLLFWQQKYDQLGIQNINGALFLFLTNGTFQNLIGVIMTFCGELPLFLREHKNGMYRTDVYFLSKMLADIPTFSLLNIMMVSICYLSIGLNADWPKILNTIGIMLLVVYTVMSTGYLISTLAPNVATANSLITMVVTPFLIFGGFFLNIRSVPTYFKWLSSFSWFKYGNTALLINQWTNVTSISCTNNVNSSCLKNGDMVLESMGISIVDFWYSIIALVFLTISLRILSFCTLLYKAYNYE